MRVWLLRLGAVLALAFVGLTFLNASWLAEIPLGKVKPIANRGVYQAYDRAGLAADSCTAARIDQPYHPFIENTVASLRKARSLAAGMVELDLAATSDGQLVVFNDAALDCRTDGKGRVRDHTLAELKALDAGYGYTADGGKSFPLRGQGVGLIPTIEEFLRAAETKPLMFNFTGADAKDADLLAAALKAAGRDPVKIGDAFHAESDRGPIARIRKLYPAAWAFSTEGSEACTGAYALQGWIGLTPDACKGGTLIVPLDRQWAVAGWPNRTIARMKAVDARIVIVAPAGTGDRPQGLDLPEQLGEIPASFNGYAFVDDMWMIGPALHPSIDRRSDREIELAQKVLERRRARR